MMRYLFLLILLTTPAIAEPMPTRALFTPVGTATVATPTSTTTVSNFIYISPSNWRFTWRGQTVTPGSIPSGITLHAITPSRVMLSDAEGDWDIAVGRLK